MTDQLTPLAVQNAELLRVICRTKGGFGSVSELAAAADIVPNNMARKLAALIGEGLIESTGDAGHEVAITELGRRSLAAIEAFDGPPLAQVVTTPPAAGLAVHYGLIDPNPWNPRRLIDQASDIELGRSVKAVGILQRVLVRPHPTEPGRYQQALGHRRVRAARWANIDVPIDVRDISDDEMADIGVVENVQRDDLHWIDEAEGYLMLTGRGRSAAQIVALVGTGGRKKRSVQELIQFARELDEETKARCRLPEGEPQRITVDQARFMVGNKRPKLALDLTPKLAAALLELLLDADFAEAAKTGRIEVILQRKPLGGPLTTLADRDLIKLATRAGAPAVTIQLTADMSKYLEQVGFDDDRVGAVAKARAAVIGELAAGALAAGGRYLTSELNPPEGAVAMADAATRGGDGDDDDELGDGGRYGFGAPDADPATPPPAFLPPATAAALVELAHRLERANFHRFEREWSAWCDGFRGDAAAVALSESGLGLITSAGEGYAIQLDVLGKRWLSAEGFDLDSEGRFHVSDELLASYQAAAGIVPVEGHYSIRWFLAAPRPAGGAPIAPPKAVPRVSPEAGLIILELAHKIERDPRGTEWASIDPGYRHDPMSNQLVFDRLVMFRMAGPATDAGLTPPALDWLEAQGHARGDDGRIAVTDEALQYAQVAAGAERVGDYLTPWLTIAEAAAQPAPKRDDFMRQILEVTSDGHAPGWGDLERLRATLARLMAAGREAKRVIRNATSNRLKAEEAEPVIALLEAAVGDAQRDLDEVGRAP